MDATLDSRKDALPKIGSILANKYELVARLGEGGMGEVYEAIHRRLRQRFAIKLLRHEYLQDARHVQRFEREARLAARLRSENIVQIFDVDVTPAGVPYMVMELLVGRDLADEVDERGYVPIGELAAWMCQVCKAVEEAHRSGVLHRDLKPSNVFLCKTGGRTVAKVLDFGISTVLHDGSGDMTAMPTTTQESLLGTPRYMSPEQLRGAGDIDGRSDVWAIGVMMYRVLSGHYPFEGASGAQIAVAIAQGEATSLGVHRPDLPPALVDIVMKALQRKREDRFASAAAMGEALAPFSKEPTPVSKTPGSTAPAAPKPKARRRAGWWWGGALGAATAGIALGGMAYAKHRHVPAPIVRVETESARIESAPRPTAAATTSPPSPTPPLVAPTPTAAPLPTSASLPSPSQTPARRRTKDRTEPPAASPSATPGAPVPAPDNPLHL